MSIYTRCSFQPYPEQKTCPALWCTVAYASWCKHSGASPILLAPPLHAKRGHFFSFWYQRVGLSMLIWIEGSNVAVGWAKQELWACLSVTFSLRWAPLPAVQKRLIGTPKTYPAPAGWNKKNLTLVPVHFHHKFVSSVDASKVPVLYFAG